MPGKVPRVGALEQDRELPDREDLIPVERLDRRVPSHDA